MEEAEPKPRTPSQVLIDCLESFGEDEPEEVVVICRTGGGQLAWYSNGLSHCHFMGMVEMCKFWFLENRKKEGD